MQTRREAIKGALMMATASGMSMALPQAVQKAYAITPDPGTTFEDAEHIVVLMQENRSFDHMYGTLAGVRGFNDPRAIRQADDSSIFLQRNPQGDGHLPWRVDLTESKVTWMGDLPHGRPDHLDAWNGGLHNNWLLAKRKRNYPEIPLTMGYHTRDDLPFYYALADAFTVCDQNFCGGLLETAPNRLFMWSGTVREQHDEASLAYLRNWQTQVGALQWKHFPELLEEAQVSWKFYQNDTWCESPLSKEDFAWLGNDGDNTLERFASVPVKFAPAYKQMTMDVLDRTIDAVSVRLRALKAELTASPANSTKGTELQNWVRAYKQQIRHLESKRGHGLAALEGLSPFAAALREKIMTTNSGDPYYRTLENIPIDLDGAPGTMEAPKGDVLHQFRQDVRNGQLPTVSWLVAAANFSAHPGAPFYGAWYTSEVMNILTENPEVWKKTIFILTYDENDGFFDHIPPFVAPDPKRPETGKVSPTLNATLEYAYKEDERIQGSDEVDTRDGPIGLGCRVPMIIASPWSRGGWVNSQVHEHSSIIQFLETFLHKKTGKKLRHEGISSWRRSISGDLTSCFRPYDASVSTLPYIVRDQHLEAIQNARSKPLPKGYLTVSKSDLSSATGRAAAAQDALWQESGVRPSCALPYELHADGRLDKAGGQFAITMEAGNALFAERASGAPFIIMLHGVEQSSQAHAVAGLPSNAASASYAVDAGDTLLETIDLSRFAGDTYDMRVHGPNGFFRCFTGKKTQPESAVVCRPKLRSGGRTAELEFTLENTSNAPIEFLVRSNHYATFEQKIRLRPMASSTVVMVLKPKLGAWYDVSVTISGQPDYLQHYAGRVETGVSSITDPLIAKG